MTLIDRDRHIRAKLRELMRIRDGSYAPKHRGNRGDDMIYQHSNNSFSCTVEGVRRS